MAWQVVMNEDGVITLPPDLLAKLGWTSETRLHWINGADGVTLAPMDDDELGSSS